MYNCYFFDGFYAYCIGDNYIINIVPAEDILKDLSEGKYMRGIGYTKDKSWVEYTYKNTTDKKRINIIHDIVNCLYQLGEVSDLPFEPDTSYHFNVGNYDSASNQCHLRLIDSQKEIAIDISVVMNIPILEDKDRANIMIDLSDNYDSVHSFAFTAELNEEKGSMVFEDYKRIEDFLKKYLEK